MLRCRGAKGLRCLQGATCRSVSSLSGYSFFTLNHIHLETGVGCIYVCVFFCKSICKKVCALAQIEFNRQWLNLY